MVAIYRSFFKVYQVFEDWLSLKPDIKNKTETSDWWNLKFYHDYSSREDREGSLYAHILGPVYWGCMDEEVLRMWGYTLEFNLHLDQGEACPVSSQTDKCKLLHPGIFPF